MVEIILSRGSVDVSYFVSRRSSALKTTAVLSTIEISSTLISVESKPTTCICVFTVSYSRP